MQAVSTKSPQHRLASQEGFAKKNVFEMGVDLAVAAMAIEHGGIDAHIGDYPLPEHSKMKDNPGFIGSEQRPRLRDRTWAFVSGQPASGYSSHGWLGLRMATQQTTWNEEG